MNDNLAQLIDLQESDWVWLSTHGHLEDLAPGTVLIQTGKPLQHLYIVLQGHLSLAVTGVNGQSRELTQMTTGEIAGVLSFIDGRPASNTVTALTSGQVLRLSYSHLSVKLKQDLGFAGRFYKAICVIFSNRLRGISALLVKGKAVNSAALRKVLFVFAELYDSDIDWMIATGKQQRIQTERETLIQQGEPAEALYLLLEGTLAISITVMDGDQPISKEVARLSTGEIVGEMSFIDARPPSATVVALANSWVLGLPRTHLAAKLGQDQGFASRFYRAMAIILADRIQDRLSSYGYSKPSLDQDQDMDEDAEYEDELDVSLLGNVAKAGMRFDWLIRQLHTSG